MTVCKNCTYDFEGKFCSKCGQKAKTDRITTRQVIRDAYQHFIHFDQGFLYTAKELLLHPGHSIRSYLEGKRVKHTKPLRFMFWAVAFSFLVFHFIGLDQDMVQRMESAQQIEGKGQQFYQSIMQWIMNHPTVPMLCMIPMLALWSRILFYRKRYNYAEHFVLNAYLIGELSLASIVTAPISKMVNHSSNNIWMLSLFIFGTWLAYFGWGYSQFFQSRFKIWTWIRGGLTIFLSYLLLILLISILIMLIFLLFEPQLDQWLNN